MSSKHSLLQAPVSDFTREQYAYYLQDQLEKLSSFMLYQKKQNQKHNLMNRIIQEQNQKIKFLNDRVLIVELYQNQNLKNQQKLYQSTQKAIQIEKRVEKIQNFAFEQRSRTIPNKNAYNSSSTDKNMKLEIMLEIDEKIKNIHEDLYGEMDKLQSRLMKKLKKLSSAQEISQIQNFTFKEPKNRVISKDVMSPLQTNYSQNGQSRLRQLQRLGQIDKKQMKRMQKRINSIIDQKISKFQNQLNQIHINEYPSSSNFSSMQQSQLIQDQERSPISTYLKKQNEYKSNKQNINSTNRYPTSKSFYSACDKKPTKNIPQIQMKSKSKSRSKSRRSKSNRSVQKNRSFDEIVDKKLNKALKIAKRQQKSIKNPNYTQQRVDKIQNSLLKKKKISQRDDDFEVSLNKKDADKCCKKEKKRIEKNKKSKRSVSKSISKHSNLSISQTSDISRSRSRSLTKLDKNQKQYMMYCDKMH